MLILFLALIEDKTDKLKFEEIYHRYHQDMYYIAQSILHDRYYAEDATQEALIVIARNINLFTNFRDKKSKNLIYIITKNKSLDFYRRIKRQKELFSYNIIDFKSFEHLELNLIENERIRQIAKVITELPYVYQEILELHLYDELSRKEIAELLGISYNAAKLRLLRGRKILITELYSRGIVDEKT